MSHPLVPTLPLHHITATNTSSTFIPAPFSSSSSTDAPHTSTSTSTTSLMHIFSPRIVDTPKSPHQSNITLTKQKSDPTSAITSDASPTDSTSATPILPPLVVHDRFSTPGPSRSIVIVPRRATNAPPLTLPASKSPIKPTASSLPFSPRIESPSLSTSSASALSPPLPAESPSLSPRTRPTHHKHISLVSSNKPSGIDNGIYWEAIREKQRETEREMREREKELDRDKELEREKAREREREALQDAPPTASLSPQPSGNARRFLIPVRARSPSHSQYEHSNFHVSCLSSCASPQPAAFSPTPDHNYVFSAREHHARDAQITARQNNSSKHDETHHHRNDSITVPSTSANTHVPRLNNYSSGLELVSFSRSRASPRNHVLPQLPSNDARKPLPHIPSKAAQILFGKSHNKLVDRMGLSPHEIRQMQSQGAALPPSVALNLHLMTKPRKHTSSIYPPPRPPTQLTQIAAPKSHRSELSRDQGHQKDELQRVNSTSRSSSNGIHRVPTMSITRFPGIASQKAKKKGGDMTGIMPA